MRESTNGGEGQRERKKQISLLSRGPDVGLGPRTPDLDLSLKQLLN